MLRLLAIATFVLGVTAGIIETSTAAATAAAVASSRGLSACTYQEPKNASSPFIAPINAPFNPNFLTAVSTATESCGGEYVQGAEAEQIACVRNHIDTLDIQIAYLVAKRLDFAGLVGVAKRNLGMPLDNAVRDEAVERELGNLVMQYGGSENAGVALAKSLIHASLEFEEKAIVRSCKS